MLLFGLMNVPAVQEQAKKFIVKELKAKIDSDLGIGHLHFKPFNKVDLYDVYLYDQAQQKVLIADKISAGIDLMSLMRGRLVFTSAHLADFEVHLSKEASDTPLNIQYIIDAFKPQDDKPKSNIDVVLSAVSITNGRFYYDVKDKPEKEGLFDQNHIAVSEMNAKFALKSLKSDSLNIQVKKFNLKEKSGLEISNLVFRVLTQDKKVSVRGFKLEMPSSSFELSRCELDLTPSSDTAKIMDYAQIDLQIGTSHIAPKDIAALSPIFSHSDSPISLRGHISGSVDNFMVSDLSVAHGDKIKLVANAEIKDVRDKEKTYIIGNVDELTVSSNEIETLINNFSSKRTNLPDQLRRLGVVSFVGDISGYLKQLTAFGSFETALGVIKTDVLFGFNPRKGIDSYIQGNINMVNFELGKLLNNEKFNKASLNLKIETEKPSFRKLSGKAKGSISGFDYNGYTYQDIALDATYDGLRFDGQVNVDDPNGSLWIGGLFDLTDKENPELNFGARVKNVQLDKLHLFEKMAHSYLSFSINADFTGKDIDALEGIVRIDSIDFLKENKIFLMDKFLVEVSGQKENRNIKISSDILNGEINGAYSFMSMFSSMQKTLYPYLPALIKQNGKKTPDEKTNILDFNFSINNTENLSEIFNLPVTLYSTAKIFGNYNNIHDNFEVNILTPSLKAGGMNIRSGYVKAYTQNDAINSDINLLVLGKNDVTNNITIKSKVKKNHIETNIALSNDGKQKAKGNFSISALFAREKGGSLQVNVDLLPSQLLLNNAGWAIDKAQIQIQEGLYAIDNFRVYNEDSDQEVKINGKYSQKNTSDILKAELKNIDLEYVFQTLAIDALQFGGYASGKIFVSTIESKPYANTRLQVADFKFNGTELGHLNLFSELDDDTRLVKMDGLITSKENKQTTVDGSLDPIKQKLSIHFDADSLDVSFLNKYAQAVFQDITGRGTGKVHLFGDFSDVTVEGKAFIQNGSLGINFLNTRYSFTDTVFMKKDLIYFNDLILKDQYNNMAQVSGKVTHDFFRDFMYQVDLKASNFLLYNATASLNPLFYGKVFGSGNGTVSGDENVVDINVRMRTENNTVVRMNFMEDVISEYSFINYKSKNATDSVKTAENILPTPIKTESGMDINMDFYIDATPDAVVELLMDPVGGDVLRGSGSGAMQFRWTTKDSPRLFGTYNIIRGGYTFTFQRLMERRFAIQDGSNVQFRGDPFGAILDVTAIYKINASLNDLDKELARNSGQTTVPVNCILNLTGELKRPNVGLDIAFPATDGEVERQIKSLINTEDEISKQVASLLILSKFRSPQNANVDHTTSEFSAIASATLSNQLTKLISQIDDRWQLGTNVRYDDKSATYTEAELLLSSQLFNDRLLINGNFGYRNDLNIEKQAMVADVDIEYILNNAGTWRIKAYNHYNEKFYYTMQATQTQGIGVIYKKDFDNLQDLFRSRRLKDIVPKTDTLIPVIPDSTKKGSEISHFIKLKK